MKLIAHRGGTFGKENSLETIIRSAKMGADMVECDIRKTKDGVYVIYHDEDLSRLAGKAVTVSGSTFSQMRELLEECGQGVITFEDLAKGYKEKTPILLHIKLTEYDKEFAEFIVNSGLPIIPGVVSLDMLKCFSRLLPSERILAFIPGKDDALAYFEGGAGIIRLWEHWLDKITPADVKEICPNAQVFIMSCDKTGEPCEEPTLESMDGSVESLEKCKKARADGVLLNNIEMALKWRNS